jgi:hypothetical protein
MKGKAKFGLKGAGRDSYLELVMAFPILAGKKPFSRRLIRELTDYFRLDARVLATNF